MSLTVVDIGCEAHAGKGRFAGTEESVYNLIERFKPRLFYGFDPQLEDPGKARFRSTRIVTFAKAAWLYDGTVPMHVNGDHTGITHDEATEVGCIDFPQWVEDHLNGPMIVKLDCEGAEYPLLWALHHRGLDARLEAVLVEWHEGVQWHGDFPSYGWHIMGRPPLRCEVLPW